MSSTPNANRAAGAHRPQGNGSSSAANYLTLAGLLNLVRLGENQKAGRTRAPVRPRAPHLTQLSLLWWKVAGGVPIPSLNTKYQEGCSAAPLPIWGPTRHPRFSDAWDAKNEYLSDGQKMPAGIQHPAYADKTPRQVWQELNEYVDFHSDEDPQRREGMLFHFHKGGYEARSHAVSRALRKLHDPRVSMTEVPEGYACLPDGTRFLQYHTPELHIYYSAWVIEKACALGLKAIVADGVHDLQIDATNKTGQLYVIHGVTDNGVDIPMLYAITTRLLNVLLEARCDGQAHSDTLRMFKRFQGSATQCGTETVERQETAEKGHFAEAPCGKRYESFCMTVTECTVL
uniref:SRR1 domain-containing protein n=1 Tax=Haemonchus contortus TaxID=6289 RepID=A0A7I5E665_HAECO